MDLTQSGLNTPWESQEVFLRARRNARGWRMAEAASGGHPAMGGVLAASLAEKAYIGSGTVLDGPSG